LVQNFHLVDSISSKKSEMNLLFIWRCRFKKIVNSFYKKNESYYIHHHR
jgi:hypothetical protein